MTQDSLPENKKTKQISNRIRKSDFKYHFYIESFGVKIGVSSNAPEAIEALKKAVEIYLPDSFTEIAETAAEHKFLFIWNENKKDTLLKDGEKIFHRELRETSVDSAASRIRLTVAEFAADHVFIHAGVVSRKGKAVILPGRSFYGKTTLTAALLKRGAIYYSDEYAILDADGFLHPFPKMLSLRGDDAVNHRKQTDYPVEQLGSTAGTEKIRVGAVLITEYKEKARWKPVVLTPAQGIIEILRHAVAIRQNPQFTLGVLNKIAADALFVKSKRGDVSESADLILKFIDDNL